MTVVSSSPNSFSFALGIQNATRPRSANVLAAKSRMSSSIRVKEYGFFGAMYPGRLWAGTPSISVGVDGLLLFTGLEIRPLRSVPVDRLGLDLVPSTLSPSRTP
ncbi:hypothetical protein CLCR_09322 [Cladophialophora carrionii]|uniref:Uncharacterized protein n=1 Tax=Cladophialophora carrionii TaxID=86049 RepID=A0A1C1CTN2_9EURO|nr:hypothetical protein CLCR_09322 [Cladophialophora carrionii]